MAGAAACGRGLGDVGEGDNRKRIPVMRDSSPNDSGRERGGGRDGAARYGAYLRTNDSGRERGGRDGAARYRASLPTNDSDRERGGTRELRRGLVGKLGGKIIRND